MNYFTLPLEWPLCFNEIVSRLAVATASASPVCLYDERLAARINVWRPANRPGGPAWHFYCGSGSSSRQTSTRIAVTRCPNPTHSHKQRRRSIEQISSYKILNKLIYGDHQRLIRGNIYSSEYLNRKIKAQD